MKDVLIILSQKPIVIVACHFLYISLNIFIKVKKPIKIIQIAQLSIRYNLMENYIFQIDFF